MESGSSSASQSELGRKYFFVEHVDLGLFDWALCEYENMMKYLRKTSAKIVFTNTNNFVNPSAEKENENYKKNVATLHKMHEDIGGDLIVELNQKIGHYIKDQTDISFNDKSTGSTSADNQVTIPFKRTILLDMRAEKELEPSDFENYDVFVFGGILGDHPPQDRTKELRNEGFELRKLTAMQMSTDTAVLASKIIMYDHVKLHDIPFVEEPEIDKKDHKGRVQESCQMEGFTYVSAQYDPLTSKFSHEEKLRNEPIMHPKIKNELLFVEFNFN